MLVPPSVIPMSNCASDPITRQISRAAITTLSKLHSSGSMKMRIVASTGTPGTELTYCGPVINGTGERAPAYASLCARSTDSIIEGPPARLRLLCALLRLLDHDFLAPVREALGQAAGRCGVAEVDDELIENRVRLL